MLEELQEHFILYSVEALALLLILFMINQFVYDRYVQRKSALLINYPIIGRMRYLFETLREPFRQYFGSETFYESRDKVDWVYKASKNVPNFISFSVSQPFDNSRFIIKHSNFVLNSDEVDREFNITFGKNLAKPFVTHSVIARSAMSDGALSPEATRAFSTSSARTKFPLNTGEGGLTSNYFMSHKIHKNDQGYLEMHEGGAFAKAINKFAFKIFNGAVAIKLYRSLVLPKEARDTYILDKKSLVFFRPDWSAPLEAFPKEIPEDMPELILQIGSGLYGVRDEKGDFDPERYKKVMRFCRMTEIKIAQGAKQTGGKIAGVKVTDDISYYRGVPAGEDLISPNRFPYAHDVEELMDFIGTLQELSEKPVGMKIVISDRDDIDKLLKRLAQRKEEGKAIPSYIAVDSGEGGSATAPLELMESIGLDAINSVYVLDTLLRKHDIRDDIKIVSSGKYLTPDDVVVGLSIGADMIAIARGFMMSAGCIRARVCNGMGGHICPVGLATQDKKRRASFLVFQKSHHVSYYHDNLVNGIKNLLAVMGKKNVDALCKENLTYKEESGEIYFNVDKYFHHKLHV
jgi:glutamate synthase domain-containing protein 2